VALERIGCQAFDVSRETSNLDVVG
jgi:hypothetical protein